MAKPRLIVFDWDQTLWNSWDIHIQGLGYAADHLGLVRPPVEFIANCYSVPIVEHVEKLFQRHSERVMALYMEFYHAKMKELGHLYDGVAEAMATLKHHGYSLAVFSDKRVAYGESEVNFSGIGHLFDTALFREEGRAYKPDPQGLRQLLDRLSVPTERALVVGDSHVDVECAQRAGVPSAAALWGSVNSPATLNQGPDYVWGTVQEMEGFLTAPDD